MEKITVGEIVHAARHARGWTTRMVSRRCGIDADTISKLERGQAARMFEKAIKILQALQLDLNIVAREITGKHGYADIIRLMADDDLSKLIGEMHAEKTRRADREHGSDISSA